MRLLLALAAAAGGASAGAPAADVSGYSWSLALRQTVSGGNGGRRTVDEWLAGFGHRGDPNYSRLNTLGDADRYSGAASPFVFKFQWPSKMVPALDCTGVDGGCVNVWAQDDNPVSLLAASDWPAKGYTPLLIQAGFSGHFKGLLNGKSGESHSTALCNNCDKGDWWWALGSCTGGNVPCGNFNDQIPSGCFPGPSGVVVDVAELWVGKPARGGWEIVGGLLGAAALYFFGGIGYGSTGGRKKGNGAAMLASHPMHARHAQLPGLVLDGVAFFRLRIAGGGGYKAVAAAAPAEAPSAVSFAKGDSVEYESSKGPWKLTKVTKVSKGVVDTEIKKGIKDMSKLRRVRVIKGKAKVDKKAQAKLEKVSAKLEKEKKKVKAAKQEAKSMSKGAKKDRAAAQEAIAAAEKAAAKAASAAKAGGGGRAKSTPESRTKYTGPARAAGGKDDVWIKADRTEAQDAGLL